MILIARMQIVEGLKDAKFLLMALLVLLAFLINGAVYSFQYELAMEDWRASWHAANAELDQRKDVLQHIVNFPQEMVKAPPALAFVVDNGEDKLPNAVSVNAFRVRDPDRLSRGNEMMATIPGLDWSFIIGTLMSLMAILVSFSAICGEKKDGTLKLLMSYPVSRKALFMGKFLGLLLVTLVILLLGVILNIAVILTIGAIPLTTGVLLSIGWVLLFAVLGLAFFTGVGLMVSSLTRRPAVSLVVLLIFWVVVVVAIPGAAKLYGEQVMEVPSNYQIRKEMTQAIDDVRHKHPDDAGNWNGDPFADNIPRRAAWVQEQLATEQRYRDISWDARIRQAREIAGYSAFSPAGLLNSVMEKYAATGLTGFEQLLAKAHEYRRVLMEFTKARDALDDDSPHLIYSWGASSDRGVFSRLPVELSAVPRNWDLWRDGGIPDNMSFPWFELLVLSLMVLVAVSVAFVALIRYDPR